MNQNKPKRRGRPPKARRVSVPNIQSTTSFEDIRDHSVQGSLDASKSLVNSRSQSNLLDSPDNDTFLYAIHQTGDIVRRSRRLNNEFIESLQQQNTPEPSTETTSTVAVKQPSSTVEPPAQSPFVRFRTKESEARSTNFELLLESVWLSQDNSNSNRVRSMRCDCKLSEIEMKKGKRGCSSEVECINRMLYFECGPNCRLGENCDNQNFKLYKYAKCSVFETEKKGLGIRADEDIPAGTFLMEYTGEIITIDEFGNRVEEYKDLNNNHFYFLSLSANLIIDSTKKGNMSRFINHSCDPNAQTQLWTVDNEQRYGFFSLRDIKCGEEITFDYQYQQYGNKADKCFCESSNCRGWIRSNSVETEQFAEVVQNQSDEDQTDENKTVSQEGEMPQLQELHIDPSKIAETNDQEIINDGRKIAKLIAVRVKKIPQKKKPKRVRDDLDCKPLIQKLESSGLKNKSQCIELARLIQRVKTKTNRIRLMEILLAADQTCKRAFVDLRGLHFLREWLAEIRDGFLQENMELFKKVMEVLSSLPIANKTILTKSGIIDQFAAIVETMKAFEKSPETTKLTNLSADLLSSWNALHEDVKIPKREFQVQPPSQADKEWDENVEIERKKSLENRRCNKRSFSIAAISQKEPDYIVQPVAIAQSSSNISNDSLPTRQSTNPDDYILPPMDIPEGWKYAIDDRGRIYYYNVKIRVSQWTLPPKFEPLLSDDDMMEVKGEFSSETDSNEDYTDESSDSELEELTKLVKFLKRKHENVQLSQQFALPRQELMTVEKENSVSLDDEISIDPSPTCKPLQSHSGQSKSNVQRQKDENIRIHSSSEIAKFENEILKMVKESLQPYYGNRNMNGWIESSDDFKLLAKKLVHNVFKMEMESRKSKQKPLIVSESMVAKVKSYITKYMRRFNGPYRSKTDKQNVTPDNSC